MRFSRTIALLALAFAACSEAPPLVAGPTEPGTVDLRGAERDTSGRAAWVLDLGTVEPGSVRRKAIVLANPGDEPVAVRIEGIAAPFGGAPDELSLGPGEEKELSLEFAPEAWGEFTTTAVLRWGARSLSLLLVGTTPAPPCTLTVDPPQLDFGKVRVGHEVGANIELRLSDPFACTGLGYSFESDGSLEIEPIVGDEGVSGFQVTWLPQDEGDLQTSLALEVGDTVQEVPLTGLAASHCGELTAERIDFGVLVPACGYAEQTIELRNTCSYPLEPVPAPWWRIAPPTEFEVAPEPASPSSLAPGASARFVASYLPEDMGYDVGRLQFWEGPGSGAPLDLTGEGAWAGNQVTDTFEQPGPPEVLLVVDGSIFIEPYAGRLDAFVSDLVELLGPYGARLGVTSTTLVGTDACPGEDGRLVPVDGSRERIVRLDAPEALEQVRAHLADVATCAESSEGAAIEAAARALTPPLIDSADDPRHPEPDDGNLGLVEHGQLFRLIFVSARDELSPDPLDSYYDRFALMPVGPGSRIFSYTPGSSGCDGLPSCPRYSSNVLFGQIWSICAERWQLPTWPWSLPPSSFELSHQPRDLDFDGTVTDELEVRIGGTRIAADDSSTPWTYDPAARSIVFEAAPQGPSTIEITYIHEGCAE